MLLEWRYFKTIKKQQEAQLSQRDRATLCVIVGRV